MRTQLLLLVQQTFSDFEVIVSDNDPEASAKKVILDLNDSRLKYFHNEDNLGMIRSFNKSIERAESDLIVMVTDDDPVQTYFLATFHEIIEKHPGLSIYAGFTRRNKFKSEIEIITKENFSIEILDPYKTSDILWSSCIVKKSDASKVGLIPDYGSPHLADHAFVALVGSENGGVIVNDMFSSLSSHDANFSKFNFDYYVKGCVGFFQTMKKPFEARRNFKSHLNIVQKHLGVWFIANMFTLKKYYTIKRKDKKKIDEINYCAKEILLFPFMRKFRFKYYIKDIIFFIKKIFGRLRYS